MVADTFSLMEDLPPFDEWCADLIFSFLPAASLEVRAPRLEARSRGISGALYGEILSKDFEPTRNQLL